MKHETHTRKKVNAVFFAAIMVLSMAAVGFAVAPASASGHGSIDGDVALDSGSTFWQGQELGYHVNETLDDNTDLSGEDEFQIRHRDGDTVGGLVDEFTFDNETARTGVISTENLESGDYVLVAAGQSSLPLLVQDGDVVAQLASNETRDADWEITSQRFSTEFDDEEVNNDGSTTTELEFDSNRGTYTVDVTVDGIDGDDLYEIFNSTSDFSEYNESATTQARGALLQDPTGDDDDVVRIFRLNDGDRTVDFDGVSPGEYEFEFDVIDTTAEDTASITVNDFEVGDVSFADSFVEQEVGDIAEIVIELTESDDIANVTIGDESVGYMANVTIDSGGEDEVTLLFNTYAAGHPAANDEGEINGESVVFDVAEDEASIDHVEQTTNINGVLDAGDYELEVGTDSFDAIRNDDEADDVGTLVLENRATNGVMFWTASDEYLSGIEDVDDIEDAIDDGLITESELVAEDDLAVFALDVSGLTGALEVAGALDDTDDPNEQLSYLLDTNNTAMGIGPDADGSDMLLEMRLRQTRDTTPTNAQRNIIQMAELLGQSDSLVVVDDATDTVYIVTDSDDFTASGVSTATRGVEDGDEYEVRFSVQDHWLLDVVDTDEDESPSDFYERVNAAFTFEERDFDFDVAGSGVIEVEAGADQVISGTTNVAPGSEFTVRVRSASGVSPGFIFTESAAVDADRSWSGEEFDFSEASVDDEFTATARQIGITDPRPSEDGVVVESLDEETPTPTEEETPTETEEETPTPTEEDTPTEDPGDDTDDDTPGFGAIVALVALLAAALLATRRRP